MPKNKNTRSRWMNTGKKIKSIRRKKLDLDTLLLSDPADAPTTKSETKKKKGKAAKGKKVKPEIRQSGSTYLDCLNHCDTIEKVECWLFEGNSTLQRLALKSTKRKELPSDLRDRLDHLIISKGATSDPILLDHSIQHIAFQQLHENLVSVSQLNGDGVEFAFVTIIDGKYETSSYGTMLDLQQMKESGRRILQKMSPNFFAVIELAIFNSPKHPSEGRLISPHIHAIIWGEDVISKARSAAATLQRTITSNATGAAPIVVRTVEPDPVNLARMAAYLVKSPDKCKTFYPGKNGKPGNTHHSRKSDRLINYLRLAELRSMLTFRDVTFASGEGLAIRSGTAKTLTHRALEQARMADRRFHPAEIPTFWTELKLAMGTTRFNLPIIKRTK